MITNPAYMNYFNTRLWQMLLSKAEQILFVFDHKGKEIFVSESSENILGYQASEVIEKSLAEILCGDNRDYFPKSFNEVLRCKQEPMYVELLMKHRNGKQIFMGGHLLCTDELDSRGYICLFVRDISYEKQIENERNVISEKVKNVNKYIVQAREKERQNIASALHDDIGQLLTALKLELGLINDSLDHVLDCQPRISKMIHLIDKTALQIQKISYELRPFMPENLSLTNAIRQYCIEWGERTGLNVNLNIDSVILNYDISQALFRIVQEALTNVARHANATSVKIDLLHSRDSLSLVVEDDGVGISEDNIGQQNSYGIIGMKERAALCNGTLLISGQNGTKITLTVPFFN